MLEQLYVIKFLPKDPNGRKETRCRLKAAYGDEAMKQTQVLWWLPEAHRGRKDLSDSLPPRQPPEIRNNQIQVHRLERDPR
jgi:hypothetical protein